MQSSSAINFLEVRVDPRINKQQNGIKFDASVRAGCSRVLKEKRQITRMIILQLKDDRRAEEQLGLNNFLQSALLISRQAGVVLVCSQTSCVLDDLSHVRHVAQYI
jgi:hypothetical protein